MPRGAVAYKEDIIPPYYDRFLDEREKRFVVEIQRLEELIKSSNQQINQRIDGLGERIDGQINGLGKRIDGVEGRMDRLECKMDRLERKMDHHFYWMIGLFVPLILSAIGSIISTIFK